MRADPVTVLVNDPDFTLHLGDVLEVLQELPDESVHCVVTSPPYWGLRDYGTGSWVGGDPGCDHPHPKAGDVERNLASSTLVGTGQSHAANGPRETCGKCGARRVDQQLGLEPTPDQYVENMVRVFREVRRVLRRDGTLWLNIGDSYSGGGGYDPNAPSNQSDGHYVTNAGKSRLYKGRAPAPGLKPKDLCGIPWRLAFALQADGWYLRSEIIWAKPNPMPESVTDRPTKSHEQVFLLTREPRYFYDADAVREPQTTPAMGMEGRTPPPNKGRVGDFLGERAAALTASGWIPNGYNNPAGRNLRSVWNIATEPYPDAHFATFPQALVEPCVKAGTSERGCCPVCGAPWERETERGELVGKDRGGNYTGRSVDIGVKVNPGTPGLAYENKTTGWKPTCAHGPEPVPCVVLDPFMGSGTVALVARRLGRRSIGIELNPAYAQLCVQRTRQLSLLAEAAP